MSVVYFARREDGTGPIKIGTTAAPEQRLRSLCTIHKAKLVFIAVTAGGYRDEGRLHRQFADDRVEGEWFTPSPAVLGARRDGVVTPIERAKLGERARRVACVARRVARS